MVIAANPQKVESIFYNSHVQTQIKRKFTGIGSNFRNVHNPFQSFLLFFLLTD